MFVLDLAESEGPLGYFEYGGLAVRERAPRTPETAFEDFVEGDRVEVVADVVVKGASALGRRGTVERTHATQ